jgi:hypothetical protein
MYKRQFKKWGLSKYMKAPEKDKLIQVIYELDQASSERDARLPRLGDTELRKLVRHIKVEFSKKLQRQRDHRARKAADPNAQSLDEVMDCVESDVLQMIVSEHSLNHSTWQQAERSTFMASSSLFQSSFSVTNASGSVDMRFLFQSVQTSCSYFVPDDNEFSATAGVFWRKIKHAIHLLRIASPTRAWPSLSKAYDVAGEALLAADIGSFVREILTTLSPVNNRACPHARQQIIQYLTDIAQIKLASCHPITVVLQQLLFDGPTRDVSERCLAWMVEVGTGS